MRQQPHTQPDHDAGIPDLVRRLTDDSKRLAGDEIRLAKLEIAESVKTSARASMWLGLAFGIAVVGAVALTVGMAAALRSATGNWWAGAVLTGIIELAGGAWLLKRGLGYFAAPSYSLEASRESLKDTAAWAKAPRAD